MQATGVRGVQQAKPLVRPPDALTVLRVPLALAFVAVEQPWGRLGIVLAAAATDFVDGMWARRIGGSRVGAVLDPVCDKLFMLAAFVTVFRSGVLSIVEVVAVLLRDILAAIGFLWTLVLRRPATLPARAGGKIVTVVQLLTLVAFVIGSDLVRPLAWATAGISIYAAIDYARAAGRSRS